MEEGLVISYITNLKTILMRRLHAAFSVLATAVFLASCTPKAPVEETTVKTPTTVSAPKANEKLSPCPKFTDAPNPGQIEDKYVIYRDKLRLKDYNGAYELWQEVYKIAPAADGRRNTVITDGIWFAEYFMSQTRDKAEQKKYEDQIFAYYDKLQECYAEGGYTYARKAFDAYFKYTDRYSKKEIYDLFKQAIEIDGDKVGDFIINPFTNLLVERHEAGEIDDQEAREMYDFIMKRIELAKAAAKTQEDIDRMAIIEGYAPVRLAYFETVAGFFDCQYYKDKYLPQLDDAIGDYTTLAQLAGYLRFGGCLESDPDLMRVVSEANKARPVAEGPAGGGCFALLSEGKNREAADCLESKYNETSDEAKKAQYAMVIAKINYGSLRNFPVARKWARLAANHKSGWGEPYILIGKLYASSGPLCGPGTGIMSQRVVWVAIDQWNKAKAIDSSTAAEANKLIAKYAQYMPNKGDVFMQPGMSDGQSYTVDCWINETTIVRSVK